MDGPRYNQKQVREILKRAAVSHSSDSDGISLEELKQVGGELGLDPAKIELAAGEVGVTSGPRIGLLNGRLNRDQSLSGEISEADWLEMVAVVRRYFKKSGTATQRGKNFDWIASDDNSSMALTVTSANGKSHIHLESNSWMGLMFAGLFCPLVTLIFGIKAVTHGQPLMLLPIVVVGLAVWFTLVRVIKSAHLQTVESLMKRLVSAAQSVSAESPAGTSVQVPLERDSREVRSETPVVELKPH